MTTFTIGARTRTETQRGPSAIEDLTRDDGEARPSRVSSQYWIQEVPKGPAGPMDGKWMLFFLNEHIDAAWMKAKSLFRKGRLTGISAMKVSTACENSRASDSSSQVVICYCGPAADEANVLRYGENLISVMKYRPFNSNPYVYYKSDAQTAAGTRATGQSQNHLYKIRVPTRTDAALDSGDGGGVSGFGGRVGNVTPKRKLELTEEVEVTRKRISRLSPTSFSNHAKSPFENASTTSAPPSTSLPFAAAAAAAASPAARPGSLSMTRVKFRLENIPDDAPVDTIVASFHVGQSLSDLTSFLARQMPSGWTGGWTLLKTFPTEELTDMSLTVESAGLANAVVIARKKS